LKEIVKNGGKIRFFGGVSGIYKRRRRVYNYERRNEVAPSKVAPSRKSQLLTPHSQVAIIECATSRSTLTMEQCWVWEKE
jgi:hypothetical protein